MARFNDLSDEELQAKAEALGVENASTLTREQLEAAILEKDPSATVAKSIAELGDFTTPVTDQGEKPSGADSPKRDIPANGPGENVPAPGDVADQTSQGGTITGNTPDAGTV